MALHMEFTGLNLVTSACRGDKGKNLGRRLRARSCGRPDCGERARQIGALVVSVPGTFTQEGGEGSSGPRKSMDLSLIGRPRKKGGGVLVVNVPGTFTQKGSTRTVPGRFSDRLRSDFSPCPASPSPALKYTSLQTLQKDKTIMQQFAKHVKIRHNRLEAKITCIGRH